MTRTTFAALALVIPAAVIGCGEAKDPHGRQALSGTVTFQGRQVDGGSIKFVSLDDEANNAGSLIRDGKYQIPREQGLVPGTYRVIISWLEATPAPNPTAAPGSEPVEPGGERIPSEYNDKTRQKVEVKADEENKFNFTIP